MKINTKSLHYRIFRLYGNGDPWYASDVTLCSYVGNFIVGLLMITSIIFCGALFTMAATDFFISHILQIMLNTSEIGFWNYRGFFYYSGIFIYLSLLLVIICFYFYTFFVTHPNFLGNFRTKLSTKFNKICPQIEFF